MFHPMETFFEVTGTIERWLENDQKHDFGPFWRRLRVNGEFE